MTFCLFFLFFLAFSCRHLFAPHHGHEGARPPYFLPFFTNLFSIQSSFFRYCSTLFAKLPPSGLFTLCRSTVTPPTGFQARCWHVFLSSTSCPTRCSLASFKTVPPVAPGDPPFLTSLPFVFCPSGSFRFRLPPQDSLLLTPLPSQRIAPFI